MHFIFTVLTALCVFTPVFAFAQQGPSLLLDAELDDYVNVLAEPLLKQAALSPENVHVLILNDPSINAFVSSRTAIFMMSGLILHAENANEVTGVLAHEIGHLKGHHLLRLAEESSSFSFPAIIGGILGLGAVAAGAPDAGAALIAGGQAAGVSAFLKFSRSQEQQADQIAVDILQKTELSTEGLKDFFGRLRTQSLLYHRSPPAYLQTHPRSQDRQNFLEKVKSISAMPSEEEVFTFKRIQAKLYALTHTPAQTQRKFLYDNSTIANYALAIAAFLSNQYDEALTYLKTFITKTNTKANDPYITELKGHIALSRGELKAANGFFADALATVPSSPLLRFHYGRSLRLNNEPQAAITQFERILQKYPEWWMPHQEMGLAYGKLGLLAYSHISLAKAALYQGKKEDVTFHLSLASQYLEKTKPTDQIFREQEIKLLKQELEK